LESLLEIARYVSYATGTAWMPAPLAPGLSEQQQSASQVLTATTYLLSADPVLVATAIKELRQRRTRYDYFVPDEEHDGKIVCVVGLDHVAHSCSYDAQP
jgi:hypothetical protein